jgi:hypothetical protein
MASVEKVDISVPTRMLDWMARKKFTIDPAILE